MLDKGFRPMKKVFIIAAIVLGVSSCQKEVITPNDTNSNNMTLRDAEADPTIGDPDPNGDTGEITDPMRKKDKKDSK